MRIGHPERRQVNHLSCLNPNCVENLACSPITSAYRRESLYGNPRPGLANEELRRPFCVPTKTLPRMPGNVDRADPGGPIPRPRPSSADQDKTRDLRTVSRRRIGTGFGQAVQSEPVAYSSNHQRDPRLTDHGTAAELRGRRGFCPPAGREDGERNTGAGAEKAMSQEEAAIAERFAGVSGQPRRSAFADARARGAPLSENELPQVPGRQPSRGARSRLAPEPPDGRDRKFVTRKRWPPRTRSSVPTFAW